MDLLLAIIKLLEDKLNVDDITEVHHDVERLLTHGVESFGYCGNTGHTRWRTDLLLAIIKLLEDKLNVDDITEVGVQSILLVEDSVRFYSSVLPHIYKFLLKQSVIFSTEALNQHEQMLRMRGRPKVLF